MKLKELAIRCTRAPSALWFAWGTMALRLAPAAYVAAEDLPRPPSALPPASDQAGLVGDEPADLAAYERAIDDALAEHRSRNFEEARVHLLRAHKLFPNARTLRGLGKVEFELRNYGEAVRYLSEALASQVRPLDAELRGETETLLARAKAFVGELRVNIEPDSAVVSLDGVAVKAGPNVSLTLKVGEHLLEFHAHGRVSQRRSVHISGGEELSFDVVLPEQAADAFAPDSAGPATRLSFAPTPRADAPRRSGGWLAKNRAWFWPVIGAVAAGALATGLAVGLKPDPQTQTAEPLVSPNTPAGAAIVIGSEP